MIDLTRSVDVEVGGDQNALYPAKRLTTCLEACFSSGEIEEHESGAKLHFQQGGHGASCPARSLNYLTHLELVKRSQERQSVPSVSVSANNMPSRQSFAPDNSSVPAELWDEGTECTQVLFHGHDGVFCLKSNHPEFARIRVLLSEAIQQKTRVWFIAQKAELALQDVMAAG